MNQKAITFVTTPHKRQVSRRTQQIRKARKRRAGFATGTGI